MKTKSSKKERNEKVRQMVQEIAYRSMTGQKVSRNELAIKYKVSAGILTIAQHKGYIEKQGGGKYIIKVEFTDLIIDELYAAHAENTKKSTEKKNPIYKQDQLFQVPETIQTDNSFVRFVNTPIKTNYTPDSATGTVFSVPNDFADDDYLHELKPMNENEILAGVYERLAEEFMNLSKFYSK